MRKTRAVMAAFGLALILALAGCPNGNDSPPSLITWSAAPNHDTGTTAIDFVFSAPVNATLESFAIGLGTGRLIEGGVTGDGREWSLGVEVTRPGNVSVSVAIPGVESGPRTVEVFAATLYNVAAVSAGAAHAMAIGTSDSLWVWGNNGGGRLGDGTNEHRFNPTHVQSGMRWAYVSAGTNHSVAIRDDGTLWAWGSNHNGQLGDGTTDERLTPIQIGEHADWISVSVGDRHTVGIREGNVLWAWGDNGQGQLGDGGATGGSAVPALIPGTWKRVSAGMQHTVGIQTDGTLWAWGDNAQGRLGIGHVPPGGETDIRQTPTRVGEATWSLVAAGNQHTAGIQTDGTLWTWGHAGSGRLGNGQTSPHVGSPWHVAGATWISVDVGSSQTVGIQSDGSLWAWGMNGTFGQLGIGTTEANRQTPSEVDVAHETKWTSVSVGSNFGMAMRSDGTLWAWGNNGQGRLGDGTEIHRLSPTQIGMLKEAGD